MKRQISFALVVSLFTNVCLADVAPGVYSGTYGAGKATIFIDSIKNGTVKGRSLYLQNYRPLTGTVKAEGNYWRVILNEPADRTGDGQFNLLVSKDKPNVLSGSWKVFSKTNTKAGIAPKNFTFAKTSCSYKKGQGDYPQASDKLLDDDSLLVSAETLDYMRNEIFARHGYSFKSQELAGTFAEANWYVPCYTNVDKALSKIEKENIRRITEMTAYAKKNPERFSR